MPMIPNIALDNTVDKHVKALALFGATEWEVNGRKHRDWTTRKEYVSNFDKTYMFLISIAPGLGDEKLQNANRREQRRNRLSPCVLYRCLIHPPIGSILEKMFIYTKAIMS
jgi:hypothetical protein